MQMISNRMKFFIISQVCIKKCLEGFHQELAIPEQILVNFMENQKFILK
jgi:hypothetical protein